MFKWLGPKRNQINKSQLAGRIKANNLLLKTSNDFWLLIVGCKLFQATIVYCENF